MEAELTKRTPGESDRSATALTLPPLSKRIRPPFSIPPENFCDFLMTLMLIGDRQAGKTSLLLRLRDEENYDDDPCDLIHGHNSATRMSKWYKGARCGVTLWDTVGRSPQQEKNSAIRLYPRVGLMYETIYTYSCQAILLCFDASAAATKEDAPLHRLESTYRDLRQRIAEVEAIDAEKIVYFIGCQMEAVPSLIYDGWLDAREILVAMKPCIDHSSAFSLLLPEIVDLIALFWVELRAAELGLSQGRYASSLAKSYSRGSSLTRKELESFAAKHNRPMYLTSAKMNFGCENLLNSLVQNILVTYGEESDGMLTELQHWDENCEQLERKLRDDPYCIRPPKL